MSDLLVLQQRILDLERRVAALEGSQPPSGPETDPELLEAVRGGNTIAAIKRYRELTGLGLAEAKDAVERL